MASLLQQVLNKIFFKSMKYRTLAFEQLSGKGPGAATNISFLFFYNKQTHVYQKMYLVITAYENMCTARQSLWSRKGTLVQLSVQNNEKKVKRGEKVL